MKIFNFKYSQLCATVIVACLISPILAEGQGSQKSLSSTLEVYAFPKKGQDSQQQSQDEAECYSWAVNNSGSDPFDLQKQKIADTEQAEKDKQQAAKTGQAKGSAVSGAVKGAVIGELVDDDAGKGAAIGATLGVMKKRRHARAEKKKAAAATEAVEQKAASTAAATEEQMKNFKKAFSVCLEAKDYLVKY